MSSCDNQWNNLCGVLSSMSDGLHVQQQETESRPHRSAAAAASAARRASSSCLCHRARASASSLCFSLHAAIFSSHIHSFMHLYVRSCLKAFRHEQLKRHSWWHGISQHCSIIETNARLVTSEWMYVKSTAALMTHERQTAFKYMT